MGWAEQGFLRYVNGLVLGLDGQVVPQVVSLCFSVKGFGAAVDAKASQLMATLTQSLLRPA